MEIEREGWSEELSVLQLSQYTYTQEDGWSREVYRGTWGVLPVQLHGGMDKQES